MCTHMLAVKSEVKGYGTSVMDRVRKIHEYEIQLRFHLHFVNYVPSPS